MAHKPQFTAMISKLPQWLNDAFDSDYPRLNGGKVVERAEQTFSEALVLVCPRERVERVSAMKDFQRTHRQ